MSGTRQNGPKIVDIPKLPKKKPDLYWAKGTKIVDSGFKNGVYFERAEGIGCYFECTKENGVIIEKTIKISGIESGPSWSSIMKSCVNMDKYIL